MSIFSFFKKKNEDDMCECPECVAQAENDMRRYSDYFHAVYEHIHAIETENNPEVIAVYIEAIEEINKCIPVTVAGKRSIKDYIRTGFGVFKPIQEKCMKLGLV
jgi:hypothetical protein